MHPFVIPFAAAFVSFVAGMVIDHKFNVVLRVVAKFAQVRDGVMGAVAAVERKVEAVRNAVKH